jgi:hypothetical protein
MAPAKLAGIFIFCSLSAAAMSLAERKSFGLYVPQGRRISLVDYDPRLKVYRLKDLEEPVIGPNFATPAAVAEAAGLEEAARNMLKNPAKFVGTELKLTRGTLLLLNAEELAERKQVPGKR